MCILEGNCFELLNTVPDGSVDMILTDPPYGIATQRLQDLAAHKNLPKQKLLRTILERGINLRVLRIL